MKPSNLLTAIALITLSAGCQVVKTATDMPGRAVRAITPGQKKPPPVDPVEVQQTLLRFADEFSARMLIGLEKLQRGTNALEHAELLQCRIALGTETCSIASGPNAVANLLDMTVFVTATRIALEEHWQPKVFGESARPLLENCRNSETDIWQVTGKVLTPAQQTELHQAIEVWHRQNPLPESVVAARAVGFASRVAEATPAGQGKTGSVFDLLKVDPLSGLDPAVRELAQTRLFAERTLYVTQRMPMLLRWQMELLTVNSVNLPSVQQLVTNSTQITASVDRFAAVAEKLPKQLSTEREEIVKALESQEKKLTPLVNEVRQTLLAGAQMSSSVNTTLTTLATVMKQLGVGATNNATPPQASAAPSESDAATSKAGAVPPKAEAEPFRIQDYTASAAQLGATAQKLTELLITLDRTIGSTNLLQLSAQVGPVVQQAQNSGKEVVDYAFWKGILLVALLLVAALIYRFLVARLLPPKNKGNSP